jgi:hypothetical protein
MSSLLDDLKKYVTPENVNCIPSEFDPELYLGDIHVVHHGFPAFCIRKNYSFFKSAVMLREIECVDWMISTFIDSINFESITFPNYELNWLERVSKERVSPVSLFEWCAKTSGRMLMLFLKAGIQVSGAEKAFKHVAKTQFYDVPRQPILAHMLQMGIGLDYTPQYNHSKWIDNLVEEYRGRRKSCKKVVVRLLGFLRFKKTRYFSGLDPRLLKQMVVTPVWETRYQECWDTTETKKLKI